MSEAIITDQNIYKGIFKRESIDIEAENKWEAVRQAREYFKKNCLMRQKDQWLISVVPVQIKGKAYTNPTDF